MSSQPPSSLVPPTFQENGKPAQYLDWMQEQLSELLNTPQNTLKEEDQRIQWSKTISSLLAVLSLPDPVNISWHALHELIKFAEVSLNLILNAIQRIPSLFFGEKLLAEALFARVMILCTTLDLWIDVDPAPETGYLSPSELYDGASLVAIEVLRALGDEIQPASGPNSRRLMRDLIDLCLYMVKDFLSTQMRSYPMSLKLYIDPEVVNYLLKMSQSSTAEILHASQVPLVLSSLMEICLAALTPTATNYWFLTDLARGAAQLVQKAYEFLFSGCLTVGVTRLRALARTCASLSSFAATSGLLEVAEMCWIRLLLYRIQVGPDPVWEKIDSNLTVILRSTRMSPGNQANFYAVLQGIEAEEWEEDGNNLRKLCELYLTLFVPSLGEDSLRKALQMLDKETKAPFYSTLVGAVNSRLQELEARRGPGGTNQDTMTHGRRLVCDAVQLIVEPHVLDWMDDDDSLTDAHFIQRCLDEINSRFEGHPVWNAAPEALEVLARRLGDFPCLLFHPGAMCSSAYNNDKPGACFIAVYLKVAFRIFECDDASKIQPRVHATVYDALSRSLRHQTAHLDERLFEDLAGVISQGMKSQERSVRLAAGRTLVEVVKLVQSPDHRTADFVMAIFDRIQALLKHRHNRMRETTIVTIGSIAKTSTGIALRESICTLVFQMGQDNSILKGTAKLQLHAVVKYRREKSLYTLIAPYMNRIAPHLVRRISSEPGGIAEFCSVLSMGQRDFVVTTLRLTLPHLFADGDKRGLEAVAEAVKGDKDGIGLLVLDDIPYILSHAFMLQGPGRTQATLSFILKAIHDAAKVPAGITVASLVKSCLINLLTELVLSLGDEDSDIVHVAGQALRKVATELKEDFTVILDDSKLGIISILNDMLQDIRGKQSVEAKQRIIRSIGEFSKLVGATISTIAPQIMATLQTALVAPQLSDVAVSSWLSFIATVEPTHSAQYIGTTSASFVSSWSSFSKHGREIAQECLHLMVVERGADLGAQLAQVADLSSIPELDETNRRLVDLRAGWTLDQRLRAMLERLDSESLVIASLSAIELKEFLLGGDEEYVRSLTAGDAFDPLVGHLLSALYRAACRDGGEGIGELRQLVYECIGIVGATDPDRFEMYTGDKRTIMIKNLTDESEIVTFAVHLIRDVLVGAFRSTTDIKYQAYLAYALQELLGVCGFTSALNKTSSRQANPVSIKVRNRWNSLPRIVIETVAPLLDSHFHLQIKDITPVTFPIYRAQPTYRQWVQAFTNELIRMACTRNTFFKVFSPIARNKDVGVARHVLPYLVQHILTSGKDEEAEGIRTELLSVLEDQVDANSGTPPDKRLFSAQTVFTLLDHLNNWLRIIRQDVARRKAEAKRPSRSSEIAIDPEVEHQIIRIDSILSSIDQTLMAKAALQCKAYARSLMNLEKHVIEKRARNVSTTELQDNYERLHEMYAHLDEPDGMEGISTMILLPSLEHQIRQHESTGRWTSAQSCWEVRLQHEPENLDYHLGLLRCLRNLGHYDSLRTHVKGVLTRNPQWGPHLVGYQVESEWMMGHWEEVQTLVSQTNARPPLVLMAQVLLAMRSGDDEAIATSLVEAREALGAPIATSGPIGYRRSYEAALDLHLVHELELINGVVKGLTGEAAVGTQTNNQGFNKLLRRLAARFHATLPSFRVRESILNIRRTALNLSGSHSAEARGATGNLWLNSAKIARKAGHSQTAYSAILQAQRCTTPFSYIESAKLVRARGEPLRALQELENSMRSSGFLASQHNQDTIIDLTVAQDDTKTKAKIYVLHARWMADSGRFEDSKVFKEFQVGADMTPKWESGQFHLGQFQDECFKALTPADKKLRGSRMNLQTVRSFTRAIKYGSKYIYQTLPRVLTLWLDMGEDDSRAHGEIFTKINIEISRAIKAAPTYKWYTAFPQIVSRIGINNSEAYKVLSFLILMVIQEYPKQALWLFTAVAKSTAKQRLKKSQAILQKLKDNPKHNVGNMIAIMTRMTDELLALCHREPRNAKVLRLSSDASALKKLFDKQSTGAKEILIPLQESLTANLPPTSATENDHHPFPTNAPTFACFSEEIDVMSSLAKPKKLSIMGSDGHMYIFLGKKDDLRKDGRLMDFNAILNKLLKSDSDSRRRQLNIRTYGVVSLNEECGLIQWVPNTIPVRSVLSELYSRQSRPLWVNSLKGTFDKIKATANSKEAATIFVKEVLSLFPPVLHEWFVETFPEPTTWLASRTAYSRTAAVMSMVGYIVGLGDRHTENILLDTNSGDLVHVDFDCLFEKGQALETPEIVPFRLTQNLVDGFGVTGVEGVFRIACEVTLRLLRENKDCLMNVLDAFVHDPLVEWEEKCRRLERNTNAVADMRLVSQDALAPIEEKLQGIFRPLKSNPGKQLSVGNHVQALISQASDNGNLARMYVGWAPFQ